MATGTSDRHAGLRRLRATWLAAVVLVAAAITAAAAMGTGSTGAAPVRVFSLLRPAAAPPAWHTVSTVTGARLAVPPGWRPIHGDPGTASAAPAAGVFRGYLNATPQSGAETLKNWSHFRLEHVAEEGARRVKFEGAALGMRFGSGHGSCVRDTYSTSATRFREIACIVAGPHTTTVVVAAAPLTHWAPVAPVLERAVAAFRSA